MRRPFLFHVFVQCVIFRNYPIIHNLILATYVHNQFPVGIFYSFSFRINSNIKARGMEFSGRCRNYKVSNLVCYQVKFNSDCRIEN